MDLQILLLRKMKNNAPLAMSEEKREQLAKQTKYIQI